MNIINLLLIPVTPTSIAGCIIAGVIVAVLYSSQIQVKMYNGALFGLIFCVMMWLSRSYDGIDRAVAYLGIFLLWCIFLATASFTTYFMRRVKGGA